MTIQDWLAQAEATLAGAGIPTARLDSLVLIADELGVDKSRILAYPEQILQRSELENLSTKITQRANHVPLAYLRGRAEFYGREFAVNEHVLVPRPESESIVELAKALVLSDKKATIIDIGTGSGCLAITAKLELPQANVIATDVDKNCLDTAWANAKKHGAEIHFVQGSLLEPIEQSLIATDQLLILANLPYVPESFPVNDAAKHEPALALFSGIDGFDHYRQLFAQAGTLPQSPTIITEALVDQHEKLAQLAASHGYNLVKTDGLAQMFQKTSYEKN